jgi:DNA mismatch repair ATPase MutS
VSAQFAFWNLQALLRRSPDSPEANFMILAGSIFTLALPTLLYLDTRKQRLRLNHLKAALKTADGLLKALQDTRDPGLRRLVERLMDLNRPEKLGNLKTKLQRLVGTALGFVGDFTLTQAQWSTRGLVKEIYKKADYFAELLSIIAEVDWLTSATLWIHENQDYLVYPEVVDSENAFLEIEDSHHPHLISTVRRQSVPNSFSGEFGKDHFFLVTGPNMAGKSTFVRMLALKLLLAQMGLPVNAKKMRFRPMRIITNMDINDSIQDGKSYFDSETDRLKTILDFMNEPTPTFFGLDEILLGTNSDERQAAEQAFIKYAARRNHLYLLATHDLAMSQLEGKVPGFKNIHAEEIVNGGEKLVFTHKIKDGPTPHRNALRVLRSKGFPEELISDAESWLEMRLKGEAR